MSKKSTPLKLVVNSDFNLLEKPEEPVNILVVDDEPKNLAVLESILDHPDYRLIRANSGQQALMALVTHEFAVLVLDVRMPDMTGFELAQMIKDRKKTSKVPIIFLTAYDNDERHILEGYGSGAVDYLHKPVNASVLRSKVAVFAELYRKGRALKQANESLLTEVQERRRAETRLNELNESLDRRVTERTNALQTSEARLRDANRHKDEFLATLAHELRNPLAPVRNAVYLLKKNREASPEIQWASELIERQVQAMSRLIDDLMDINRINRGKIDLRMEAVDVRTIVDGAVESSRALIEECGHQLIVSMPEEPVLLHADPTRMIQALMNLLNNAAKYMDYGGVVILEARRSERDFLFIVKDKGIGIARDRLASIFELFSQVETALSRSRGGLGIGLSLTQRLVEMHGGRVSASSDGLGKGSEFQVRLPLSSSHHRPRPAEILPPAVVNSTEQPASSFRILVADDNVDAAATLTLLLELLGHKVLQVHDGQAAVHAASEFHPEVVLLDIGMPKLNGYEACQKIRDLEGGKAMTIVACTGWGQADDRRKSADAGFDQHLVKPVDPEALADLLSGLTGAAAKG